MSRPATGYQVHVGDLPSVDTIDKKFLQGLFQEVGTVKEIDLKQSRLNKHGDVISYAFVTYEREEEAKKAVEELNYTKIDGQPIRVSLVESRRPAWKNADGKSNSNLFVSNLDPAIEVSELHEAFANFGEILSCKIPNDKGKNRGYGYVQFKIYKEASYTKADGDKVLQYLAEATKIKVNLTDGKNPISQALVLHSSDAESAEYGLRSDKMKLLTGKYRIVSYTLYGKLDEYCREGWRMFAFMKKVIEDNEFDFYEEMDAIYNG